MTQKRTVKKIEDGYFPLVVFYDVFILDLAYEAPKHKKFYSAPCRSYLKLPTLRFNRLVAELCCVLLQSFSMECGICYAYRLQSAIPDQVCNDPRCGQPFHQVCLYEVREPSAKPSPSHTTSNISHFLKGSPDLPTLQEIGLQGL